MGYVNDVSLALFVSPFECGYSAGTWTPTLASDVCKNVRSAADVNFTLLIPIKLPASENVNQGARIKSIDIWYEVGTAALTAFTGPVLEKMTLSANDDNITGAAVTTTMDADHDTEAECLTTADHKMTITPATEFYLEDDYAYYISIVVDPAAGSVFTFYGAQINYELRL